MKILPFGKHTVVNNFINEDGEIIDTQKETKTQKLFVEDDEAFYWTYLSVQALLDNIDKVGFKLLFYSMTNCQWNKNVISYTKPILKDIEEKIGLKSQTVRNSINQLKKRGILLSLGSATYQINPRYFWKGDSKTRNKTLKYILEIQFNKKQDEL